MPIPQAEPEYLRTRPAPLPGHAEALRPKPPWPGPLPTSVKELPATKAMAEKISAFGGPAAVDSMLGFLREMNNCLAVSPPSRPGVVRFEVTMILDRAKKTSRGDSPFLLDSSLDERDDVHVLSCLTGILTRERPATAAELADPEDEFVWRKDVGIPVEHDHFFRWLLSPNEE